MKIGIIGIGTITVDFACRAAQSGYEVLISPTRNNSTAKEMVTRIAHNAKLVSVYQAAKAEIVIMFVAWEDLESALQNLPSMDGKIILHTNNPIFTDESFLPASAKSFQAISGLFPTAHIIKVFNALSPTISYPGQMPNRKEIYFSGTDQQAVNKTKDFLESLGFIGVDIAETYDTVCS